MKIGIVNDMPMACEALRRIVEAAPGHEVVWTARDGLEAIDRARENRHELILMDLLMPRMDGVEATRRIMAEAPCPILVVTATVGGHINKVYEAMGHGALDAVDTPSLGPRGEIAGAARLLEKIATIGKLIGKPATGEFSTITAPAPPVPLVLLGASTGGPNALAEVLAGFPKNWNACVIIVQHLDASFLQGLARWLSERSGQPVTLAVEGDPPAAGRYFLAGTDDHLVMGPSRRLAYTGEPKQLTFRPSADVFFSSVAAHWPEPGVAALLTGMGRDGAEGLRTLRRLGWHTIAQDKATSVVWGMPRVAAEIGAAVEVLPLPRIARAIVSHVDQRKS